MLQIDANPSSLNKNKLKPPRYLKRPISTGKSASTLNTRQRVEESKRINDENRIILKKLYESKSFYDHKDFKKQERSRKHILNKLNEFSGRYMKHPFFINNGRPSNPAETMYKKILKRDSSKSPHFLAKSGYKLFT